MGGENVTTLPQWPPVSEIQHEQTFSLKVCGVKIDKKTKNTIKKKKKHKGQDNSINKIIRVVVDRQTCISQEKGKFRHI